VDGSVQSIKVEREKMVLTRNVRERTEESRKRTVSRNMSKQGGGTRVRNHRRKEGRKERRRKVRRPLYP